MIHMITGPGALPDALQAMQPGDIGICMDQSVNALPDGPWPCPIFVLDSDPIHRERLPDGVEIMEMGTFVHVVAAYGPTRTWSDRG